MKTHEKFKRNHCIHNCHRYSEHCGRMCDWSLFFENDTDNEITVNFEVFRK